MTDRCIAKYLSIVRNQKRGSAETIQYYLKDLEVFCASALETMDKANPVCEVINKLKSGTWNDSPKEEQPYDVLSRYATWLVAERLETGANNERTINYKISWARTLLEVNFIPISKPLFKALVKSPKSNLAYYYKACINGIEEERRKAWEMLREDTDKQPSSLLTPKDKLLALN